MCFFLISTVCAVYKKYANYFEIFHEDTPPLIIQIFTCFVWWLMIHDLLKEKNEKNSIKNTEDLQILRHSLMLQVFKSWYLWVSKPGPLNLKTIQSQ